MAPFFRYDPALAGSILARQEVLQRRWAGGSGGGPAGRRERVAAVLTAYNRRIGAGPAALDNLAALGRGEAWAVTTGQQAGFLTGPLYAVYKAVTAILVARSAARLTGRRVVPVYWVASEDHDFAEAAGIAFVDQAGELRRLVLPEPRVPGASVGHMPVPAVAAALVGSLVASLGPLPHGGEVVAFLQAAARRSASLAEWFARVMARLFRAEGLILLDPLLPELRQELAGFFERAWALDGDIAAALGRQGERLEGAGYPAPLRPLPGQAALFLYRDGRRTALGRDGDAYRERHGDGRRWTADELARLARTEPDRFSPGAALRPLAQEELLPVLAHVAGPGEVAYLAQLGDLYPLFDLAPPVFHPRISLSLTWPESVAELAGCGLRVTDLAADTGAPARCLERLLAERDAFGIRRRFAAERERIRAHYGRLVAELGEADASLAGLGAENLGRLLHQVDYLERKAWQHLKRRHRPLVAAVRRAENLLFPWGRLQEQVLNVVPWLCRRGWDLAAHLLQAPLVAEHQLVFWEEGGA